MPGETALNRLQKAGVQTIGVGKISDIFAGSGISESHPTKSNAEGMAAIDRLWAGTRAEPALHLRQPGRFRLALRPPPRSRRICRLPPGLRCMARRFPAQGATRRSRHPHRRSRQRPLSSRHRPHPRAGAADGARACDSRPKPGSSRTSRGWWKTISRQGPTSGRSGE